MRSLRATKTAIWEAFDEIAQFKHENAQFAPRPAGNAALGFAARQGLNAGVNFRERICAGLCRSGRAVLSGAPVAEACCVSLAGSAQRHLGAPNRLAGFTDFGPASWALL